MQISDLRSGVENNLLRSLSLLTVRMVKLSFFKPYHFVYIGHDCQSYSAIRASSDLPSDRSGPGRSKETLLAGYCQVGVTKKFTLSVLKNDL